MTLKTRGNSVFSLPIPSSHLSPIPPPNLSPLWTTAATTASANRRPAGTPLQRPYKPMPAPLQSASNFFHLLGSEGVDGEDRVKDEELDNSRLGFEGVDSKLERRSVKGGREMMRRSSMVAKQVISISSALSLGFVSQLWVDISSWVVLLVEVRPNLLSGEVEWCLLEDVKQVGDVLLVKDESALENQFKLAGLETLVGYNVVTRDQQNIEKVNLQLHPQHFHECTE